LIVTNLLLNSELFLCFHRCMPNEAKPTVKQVYAIAAALCKESGENFPQSPARHRS